MVWPFQNAIYRFLECNYYCGVLPLIHCKFSIIVLGLLAFRWPFLRQPDNYLSWATSMPFASITFSWKSISESLVKTNHYSPIWRITFHWNPPIFNSEIQKKICFIPMKIKAYVSEEILNCHCLTLSLKDWFCSLFFLS